MRLFLIRWWRSKITFLTRWPTPSFSAALLMLLRWLLGLGAVLVFVVTVDWIGDRLRERWNRSGRGLIRRR